MSAAIGFTVTASEEKNCRIIRPKGEVNLQTSPQFYDALLEQVAGRPNKMVVDLAGVPYMDSSGVGTLVEIKRRVEKQNGRLILASLRPAVLGVFEITQLHRFFTIVPSVEEALNA